MVQTALQHSTSLQAPWGCGSKQLSAVTPQVPGFPGQANPAKMAQFTSHELLQQKGSRLHTAVQQAELLHAGFAWAAKQLPLASAPQ
jgi:hypothetical protein